MYESLQNLLKFFHRNHTLQEFTNEIDSLIKKSDEESTKCVSSSNCTEILSIMIKRRAEYVKNETTAALSNTFASDTRAQVVTDKGNTLINEYVILPVNNCLKEK